MMTRTITASCVALAAAGVASASPFTLSSGHADILVGYDDAAGELEIEVELVPSDPFFVINPGLPVGTEAVETDEIVFSIAEKNFDAGSGTYRFGEDLAEPGDMFLGWGAEEVPTGVFLNDTLTFEYISITGPGNFRLFDTDSFGTETTIFDAPGTGQTLDVFAESADHFTFEFDAPGIYQLELSAFATLLDGTTVFTSENAVLTFNVPTPSSAAVFALAGLAVARRRRD